ncbi:MAG: ABC transporter substrate-binding protein [Halofilum sp. (in: g-proteobacteria)]
MPRTRRRRSAAQAQQPIEIGVITSSTGTNAVQGEDLRRGIQLAIDRVNAGYEVPMKAGSRWLDPGLLDGRNIEPLVEDTESRPASAMDATRKLINGDDVEVSLGEFASGLTVPSPTRAKRPPPPTYRPRTRRCGVFALQSRA